MQKEGRMLSPHDIEFLNDAIQQMDRGAVAGRLRAFRASFPLDFTPEFYEREPLCRLRHILFGLCLHNQRLPEGLTAAA
jgi:hypothetical protein